MSLQKQIGDLGKTVSPPRILVTSPGDLVKRPYGGSNRRALNVGDILSRSGYTVETFGYANLKPGLPPMTILRSIPQWVRSLIHAIIRFKPDRSYALGRSLIVG